MNPKKELLWSLRVVSSVWLSGVYSKLYCTRVLKGFLRGFCKKGARINRIGFPGYSINMYWKPKGRTCTKYLVWGLRCSTSLGLGLGFRGLRLRVWVWVLLQTCLGVCRRCCF